MKKYLLILSLFSAVLIAASCMALKAAETPAKSAPFTAWQPSPGFKPPPIVLQYDPVAKTGVNWETITDPKTWVNHPKPAVMAAFYLRDGLKRMTGQEFSVTSSNDLSKGIVLTLLKDAPTDIQKDPEIMDALKADPNDPYAAIEAYIIRSETDRVCFVEIILIANFR